MADNLNYREEVPDLKAGLGQMVEEMVNSSRTRRKRYERAWYDNNFFDDGYHFRYVSRETGKIIDLSKKNAYGFPIRAIPKASLQIRGVANLLLQPDYQPVIYPDPVYAEAYPPQVDPMTGEQIPNPVYEQALEVSKAVAQSIGKWLEQAWEDDEMKQKLMEMVLLAFKNSVSYIQVWPDPVKEEIVTSVYDAFDIDLLGNLEDVEDSPFVVKSVPIGMDELLANEEFDAEQKLKVINDDKYADSEIKESYMRAKFGTSTNGKSNTVILREAFIKTYLNEDNYQDIASEYPEVIQGRKVGDLCMRHTFVANGVWLKDEYIKMKTYPFVSFTKEGGSLWQTSFIERFIPANKSLDIVMSRIEKHINTMTVGIWTKRKGENFIISNIPGGQEIEYDTVKPEQVAMASIPPHVFEYLNLLERSISEQGAATAALADLPAGVKSGVAIESLKATEYANLKIMSEQLKKTVRRIAQKYIELAAEYFIKPQTMQFLKDGEPDYITIIGQKGADLAGQLDMQLGNDTVVIKPDQAVDIEVSSGMAFTAEGKKEVMQQLSQYVIQLAQLGLISQDAVKVVTGKLLDSYKFGATQEFMEAMDQPGISGLDGDELMKVKIAVAEVMKDLGIGGKAGEDTAVDATKLGVMEAVNDLNKGGNKK